MVRIVSFRNPRRPADAVAERLREAGIDVAVRAGAFRISPTVYNDEDGHEALL